MKRIRSLGVACMVSLVAACGGGGSGSHGGSGVIDVGDGNSDGRTLESGAYEELLERFRAGQPIQVAFLGGSNTIGNSSTPLVGVDPDYGPYDLSWYDKEEHSFRARTVQLLQERFGVYPGQVTELNAALGAAPIPLAAFRLQRDVLADHNPDLIVIEYVVNDLQLVDLAPEEDRSIARSLTSILQQIGAESRAIAVLSVLMTVRGGVSNPQYELQFEAGASRGEHRRLLASHMAERPEHRHDVAVLDLEELFFERAIPPGIEGPVFLGEGDVYDHKHPSPYGHELIARGAVELLQACMLGEPSPIPAFEPYDPPLQPYPLVPIDMTPAEILEAALSTGFEVRPSTDNTHIFDGEDALYAMSTGANLELTFQGSGTFDLWVQGRYLGQPGAARISVRIDDGPYLYYASTPDSESRALHRYSAVADDLAPGEHTVQITRLPGSGLVAFHGFLISGQ